VYIQIVGDLPIDTGLESGVEAQGIVARWFCNPMAFPIQELDPMLDSIPLQHLGRAHDPVRNILIPVFIALGPSISLIMEN